MPTSVVSLPPPEISNLNKIEAIIKDCVTLDQKERLSSFIVMEVRYYPFFFLFLLTKQRLGNNGTILLVELYR